MNAKHAWGETAQPMSVPVVFDQHPWLFRIALVLIFIAGLGIRVYDLKDAPLDFHSTRQLYSALKARGMYYQNLESAPVWQRELAVEQWKVQGLIEPPVMERLSAMAYSLAGQEILWLPRLFSIIFWLIGAVALLLLSIELAGKNGAIFALLFYLFTPYLIVASRSFQPDPLMIALMLFSIWALMRWQRSEQWKWAVMAGLFAGLAVFIKSVVIFPIAAAFVTVTLSRYRLSQVFRKGQVWLMAVLALLPWILFSLYGLFINGQLQSQFSLRFFPKLWVTPDFWLQWNGNISRVVGMEVFLLAILGAFVLRNKSDRRMVIALFTGYFVYGLTLSYHISTHDYYQLPLVPAVALGIAGASQLIVEWLRALKWQNTLIVLTVVSYFLLIKAWDVRVELKRSDYRNEAAFWQALGSHFSPEDSIIGITPDYGYRFEYWGWHKIQNWMSSADFALREMAGQEIDTESIFSELTEGKDYFLITQRGEFDSQPALKQILVDNYPLLEETNDYILFDLRNSQP